MTTSRPLSTARTVSFKSAAEMIAVLGPQDAHLAIIEDYFEQISLRPKDLDVLITGPSEAVNTAAKLLNELRVLSSHDTQITVQVIHRLMGMLGEELSNPAHSLSTSILSTRGTTIRPKTRRSTWTLSTRTPSSSVSARRVPVRPTSPWRRLCRRCRATK